MPALLFVCVAWATTAPSFAAEPAAPAAALRAKYTELSRQLRSNQYQRTIHLVSTESSHALQGDIYAVVDYPFATVDQALDDPTHWCDVLILHINIKYCHAAGSKAGTLLAVSLGRKYDQPLADAYRIEFNYRQASALPDYFAIQLHAEHGPMSTRDYRIRVEATPLADGRTFLHFAYTYAFGLTGRIAMHGYLATIGRDKVGFTVTGRQANGQPVYIKGVRGVVERNTMRYYLAIDAYLAALTAPPGDQLEKRLQRWYKGTEQYARQLHEVERQDYLAMKRKEHQRQQMTQ